MTDFNFFCSERLNTFIGKGKLNLQVQLVDSNNFSLQDIVQKFDISLSLLISNRVQKKQKNGFIENSENVSYYY